MKRNLVPVFILSLLIAGACSSKPKKSEADLYGTGSGSTLELNGSSDSNSAGGLRTVYFAFDSASLTDMSRQVLDANSAFLKSDEAINIQIEGHCDERGSVEYNVALGESRAKSVKTYLAGQGIADARMTIVSYGKERPLEVNHDETAWSRNRRANFVITAK
jgi:peptidoglycan-associated lipoprotein